MIKNKFLLALFLLSACGSPAKQMTPQQISMLSNQQLCELKNRYAWEQNTEIEIGRRNLNCDPAFNECIEKGNKPNTPAMGICVEQTRKIWALQRELERKEDKIEYQQMQIENQRK